MAKLADAGDLKSPARKGVRVRLPAPAPSSLGGALAFALGLDKSEVFRSLASPVGEALQHIHVSTYKSWDQMGAWYWGLVKDQFTADDEVRRTVIHELMCNFRVDTRAIGRRHGLDFDRYFAADLALLAAEEREGLVRIRPGLIEATPTGELFVRNLAMCFDRYMREKHAGGSRPIFLNEKPLFPERIADFAWHVILFPLYFTPFLMPRFRR